MVKDGERNRNFGNGRLVRNLFERTIEKQATRLTRLPELNKENITTITAKDITD